MEENPAGDPAVCKDKPCEFKVCLILKLSLAGCEKSYLDTISHICEFDDATCGGGLGPGAEEIQNLPNDYSQCQFAGPEEPVTFILKDGKGCDNGDSGTFDINGEMGACKPLPTADSCTGNDLKECEWTFTTVR